MSAVPESKKGAVEAVLFDLDMTLVETRHDIAASANEVRRQLGLAPLDESVVASFIGEGVDVLLERTLGAHYAGREEDAVRRFRVHYRAHCLDRSHLYAGVPELLRALAGRPLGVVSNKPEAFSRQVLEGLEVATFFGAIVGGDSAPRLKPHPDPLLLAFAALGADPARSVMVGDAVGDVRASRAAGCRVIAVSYGLSSRAALAAERPDRIVDTPSQIGVVLEEWMGSGA